MSFQELLEQFTTTVDLSSNVTIQVIESIAIIFVLWLIRFIAIRIVNRNIDDTAVQYKWRKNLTYFIVFLGAFIVGRIWFEGLQSVATFLGLLSAGLAIALRDPVTDFAGWIFIMWRRPFDVGDRIQIGDTKGDVVDTRVFKFTVLEIGNWVHADQSTGRVIHIPNHKIFTESLANYTSDFEFIWNEIEVLVTFESNWKKAKEILQQIADKHLQDSVKDAENQVRRASKSYMIHYRYLTPIVYTDVKDSGVNLTVRHLSNPRRRRSLGQSIWEDILDAFDKEDDIELAYPTMRIYKEGE
ncbi:mechanosensitive ion channel family protein [Aliifodinibius sp. S!AR15-10]|uniref:mechanosensitive ion channel family protein n=1 Tax=Aliifodinibius sp. S!AR15-10 TaxID=2950437 RepID=UPI0028628951|nr:mechanosensitive ion channel family protein [Aliifodinibius sp. S!AR15-10]MDR8394335.1 mechanosensitive ion channel family protein [Aliifodinibius sp. S!AR15-10]